MIALTFRVYFEDTDAGGVVYHARYLAFAERARTEAMRNLGVPHHVMVRADERVFMVQHVEMDYQAPARLDDELVVESEILEVRSASCRLRQEFRVAERRIGVLNVRLACVSTADGRPARIPDAVRVALEKELKGGSSG